MIRALKLWIGSGFGSGYLPKSPGTWGSLFALIPIYFIFHSHNALIYLVLFIVISSLLNLWVSNTCEEVWGEDPGRMVIDEWAGQAVTFLTIASMGSLKADLTIFCIGFILFRFFDILKPLGINKIQNLKSGFGILADDLLAGFYALICLKTLIFIWAEYTGVA